MRIREIDRDARKAALPVPSNTRPHVPSHTSYDCTLYDLHRIVHVHKVHTAKVHFEDVPQAA